MCFYQHTEVAGVHFDHLKKAYEHPMTEVFLMFYQASSQVFVAINKFLQRDNPLIAIIAEQMISFLKKLLGKFVTITAIKAASNIVDVDYSRDKQLPGTYTLICIAICITVISQYFQLFFSSCRQCHLRFFHLRWNQH